jgi:glycosyltransferase involved in cell wall biosynthesis
MDVVYRNRKPYNSISRSVQPHLVAKVSNPDQLDREFYIKAYKDVKPHSSDPTSHYYTVGKKLERLPNADKFRRLYPEFDEAVYAANSADLAHFQLEELMSHFHHHGRSENRLYKRSSSSTKNLSKQRHRSGNVTDNHFINQENFKKIEKYTDPHDEIYLDPLLVDLISHKEPSKPIYLIMNEWGYPPYGGGECWLIDTAKWMSERGFACYFMYFNDPVKNCDFSKYEVNQIGQCTFIKFVRDFQKILKFVSLLSPVVISHQGLKRSDHLLVANLLEKPFLTGFCFWQDIIQIPPYDKETGIFNQNMINKTLIPDSNFKLIQDKATKCYVASQFMYNIVKKVHNVDLPVINTVSDMTQCRVLKPENNVYVTVVNICDLKGGRILESIINNTSLDIPFLLIDSQEMDHEINKRLKRLLIERNSVENPHKSVYIRGPIDDMKNIYKQTRILLIPTLVDETFCRVAYEGMMNNIPILSTANGNLQYLVSGYADILDHESSSWYHKINHIYHDTEYLQSMSIRPKSINPLIDQNNFVKMVYQYTANHYSSYLLPNNVGLLCPWADQGLGIQCREYYDMLEKCGYTVSVYSFKPYHSTPANPRLQANPEEWDYKNIYYGQEVREKIDTDDFIRYLHQYRVKKMIIVETCYNKMFDIAKICNMLAIQVIAIPNLETLRYSEIHQHDIFDKIVCNNHMTYDILSKYFPQKAQLVGFRILNKHFGIEKNWSHHPTFFCSGGLNSLSRKNIDKIITAFKELEAENKLGGFKLHIYIQGVELPPHVDKFKSHNIIISVGQKAYKDIVNLYKKHDIFIHMGDHEGLGLGFYESIACGTPVFTIDTPPNNEIIHEGVNGWLVRCIYTPLTDNNQGIVYKALINVNDVKTKLFEIICQYNRDQMYQSTINDYINRYPIDLYSEQVKKMLS